MNNRATTSYWSKTLSCPDPVVGIWGVSDMPTPESHQSVASAAR